MIGIVGGIGPFAGLYLNQLIYDLPPGPSGPAPLQVLTWSNPAIPDPNAYLTGAIAENPGTEIGKSVQLLIKAGATYIGIANNDAHAPEIFDLALETARPAGKLQNMVTEVVTEMAEKATRPKTGVLGDQGCYVARVYANPLSEAGFEVLLPGEVFNDFYMEQALWHNIWGLKKSNQYVDAEAITRIQYAIDWYNNEGATSIVLANIEFSMIKERLNFYRMDVFDGVEILARTLGTAIEKA